MKPSISAVFYLLLTVLLTGCTEFKHPLSDPQLSQADPQLNGLWVDHDGETFIHVRTHDQHHHEVLYVTDSIKGYEYERALLYPTTIGTDHYASVTMPKKYRSFKQPSFMIMKYLLEGDELRIWIAETEGLRQAIKEKRILGYEKKGTCTKPAVLKHPEQLNPAQRLGAQATSAMIDSLCRDTKQAPVVTAKTDELRKFFESVAIASLFKEKDSLLRIHKTTDR